MSSRTTQGDDVDFYGPLSPWILDRSGICVTETRITVTGIFTREGLLGPRGNITAIGSSHDGNDFTSAACWLLSPFTKHRFAYSENLFSRLRIRQVKHGWTFARIDPTTVGAPGTSFFPNEKGCPNLGPNSAPRFQ